VNVRPKRYLGGEQLKTIYGDFLVIECEVYSPKSSVGRTVYVFLDDDDVTMLRRECFDAARRHRMTDHKPVRWAQVLPPKKTAFEDLADLLGDTHG
jgi:hypothetical protein